MGWRVLADADAVALGAARLIAETAAEAIAQRGRFRLVLAGGRTPEAAYRLLAQQGADWNLWEFYFGDERCLPADHAERNSQMAEGAILSQVPLNKRKVHPIPAEQGAEVAAAAYARIVAAAVPFDLVLLGVGEDGHTASLFPGQPLNPEALTVAVHGAPKLPPDRVSLGLGALQSSRYLLVLAAGAGKREALERWQAGEELPITRVCHGQRVTVLLDEAANPGA
ncbi:MAG: 6-phosphogluconolactonase [Chromatiaceae bacterium]|nr:6-phosphogluconolactonase [Chromatiaceae bacterium]